MRHTMIWLYIERELLRNRYKLSGKIYYITPCIENVWFINDFASQLLDKNSVSVVS